jgi:hypothetical protein
MMNTKPSIAQSFSTRKAKIIFGVAFLLPVVAVLVFAKLMYPLHQGTSSNFWKYVCGISLDGKEVKDVGGFYPPRNGLCIYYISTLHDEILFKVPRSEVIQDFPKAIGILKGSPRTNDFGVTKWARAALKNPSAETNFDQFLSSARDERLNSFKKKDEHLYQYVLNEEKSFEMRWQKIQRFWLNILFECLFFSFVILFAFWPWIRNKGRHAWCFHFSLIPLLLFIPYYLGYCGWTFTSVGPSGGILYPWVIVWFRDCLFWTPIDDWLLSHSPKILESVSQDQGSMMSVSGGSGLGIVALLLIGCVIYACVWAIAKFVAFMVRPKSSAN